MDSEKEKETEPETETENDKSVFENRSAARNPFEDFKKNNFSIFDSQFLNPQEKEENEENQNNNENEIKEKKKIWLPRPYQKQIYEKALNQNSIIFVETGKGKTFISIMLMANYLGIDINNHENNKKIDENKKIIFFVCDTALINQQKKHIEEILNIQVGTIQGKKDKKSKSDYETFIKKWKSFNIFVAIPSIIYKILSCGFIKIFDISMLIFDECHHTNSEHPYNRIMDEFYFYYKKNEKIAKSYKFPRIYGLTASPMKTRINGNSHQNAANEALLKLSENLDCVIIIDPEMLNIGKRLIETQEKEENKNVYVEIKTHINSREYKAVLLELYNNFFVKIISLAFSEFPEKYKEYETKSNFQQYLNYVTEKFKVSNLVDYNTICQENSFFYNLKNFNKILYIFEKIQRHIFLILENLCLESLITYFDKLIQLYDKLHQKKIEEEENENSDNSSCLNNSNETDEDEDDEEMVLKLDSELILKLKKIYQGLNDALKTKHLKGELNYRSDRLDKLYSTIVDLFKSNDKAKLIVFITNRIVAHILNPTLSKFLRENFRDKKCNEIIGVNKNKKSQSSLALTPTITLNKLNKIVKDFNENLFDILIGTSAVEEGLDIQSCNAVISLAEIQTPKSYIQMKGRARKTNSNFYIFSYSKEETIKKVQDFLEVGRKMKELFNDDIKRDFRRGGYIKSKKDFLYRFNDKTHSKLTLSNVSIFYNEIKQQIDSLNINFKPKIRVETIENSIPIKFIGFINISTKLKGLKENISYKTDMCNSKDDANKMCQFWTLLALEKSGYLDDHLKFCKEKALKNA